MNLLKSLVTLGPIGGMAASGTMASLATLPFIVFAQRMSTLSHLVFIAIVYAVSIYALKRVMPLFASSDPREVVIDEFLGMWITFLGVALNPDRLLIGFIVFRFFDISKCGISWADERDDAHGIMLDDVFAGIFSNLILYIAIGFGWL